MTQSELDAAYLARTGNPTSIAQSTTFTGDEVIDGDETIGGDLIMSGTSGTNGITFPNGVKQLYPVSALTANQTYTYATVKTNSYGMISDIISTSLPSYSFTKIATAYGSYSSSYISFTINTSSGGTSGSWAQNAYFTIRYNISVDYNASTSSPYQFQNNGTATGTMNILWPYRFGSNWCAVANAPSLAQLPNAINSNSNYNMTDSGSTNIGGAIAPSGREFWSYGYSTSGTNVFYLNGTKSSIVFQLTNPSGWSSGSSYTYSIEIELLQSGAASGTVYTSDNVVTNGTKSQYAYNFINGGLSIPEGSMMCVSNVTIPYSWFNINSSLYNNNSFQYTFPTSTGQQTYTITLPNGYYDTTAINNYLQTQMIINGQYLLICYPVPTSDIIDSIPITSVFGSNITYQPPFPKWVKVKAGKYSSMTVQLVDQNLDAIVANDSNVLITLLLMMGNSVANPYTKNGNVQLLRGHNGRAIRQHLNGHHRGTSGGGALTANSIILQNLFVKIL
eukprot:scaffold5965_cov109-Ochromonas_danica.AAC.3